MGYYTDFSLNAKWYDDHSDPTPEEIQLLKGTKCLTNLETE